MKPTQKMIDAAWAAFLTATTDKMEAALEAALDANDIVAQCTKLVKEQAKAIRAQHRIQKRGSDDHQT